MFKITSKTVSAVASITPTDFTRTPLPLYIEQKIINAILEAIYLVNKKNNNYFSSKERNISKEISVPKQVSTTNIKRKKAIWKILFKHKLHGTIVSIQYADHKLNLKHSNNSVLIDALTNPGKITQVVSDNINFRVNIKVMYY